MNGAQGMWRLDSDILKQAASQLQPQHQVQALCCQCKLTLLSVYLHLWLVSVTKRHLLLWGLQASIRHSVSSPGQIMAHKSVMHIHLHGLEF